MNILFIEPDQTICDLFKTTLENRYNSKVIISHSGADALSIIESTPNIDIIVCEYIIPDNNGADIYRLIRDKYSHIIFILQTSNLHILKSDPRFKDFFDNIRLNRAISRPFTPSELFWLIGDTSIEKQNTDQQTNTPRAARCNIILDAFILGQKNNTKHHVRSLNVCKDGMFIMCDQDLLQIGDIINYEISVNLFNRSTQKAVVKWKRNNDQKNMPAGVGIEFVK